MSPSIRTILNADVAAPISEAPASRPCPRCGKSLVDPTGLAWCAGCGFCGSLAASEPDARVDERRGASLGGVVEAGGAITSLPLWFWACFFFLAFGVALSIVMDKRLPAGDNLTRASFASAQIAAGVLIIFFAQFFALLSIAPSEPTMSFKDAVAPFRLWPMVCKRLPNLRGCLWSALLGVSLIVGGAVFVGGLAHWFEYLPQSSTRPVKDRARETGPSAPVILPE